MGDELGCVRRYRGPAPRNLQSVEKAILIRMIPLSPTNAAQGRKAARPVFRTTVFGEVYDRTHELRDQGCGWCRRTTSTKKSGSRLAGPDGGMWPTNQRTRPHDPEAQTDAECRGKCVAVDDGWSVGAPPSGLAHVVPAG